MQIKMGICYVISLIFNIFEVQKQQQTPMSKITKKVAAMVSNAKLNPLSYHLVFQILIRKQLKSGSTLNKFRMTEDFY